MTYGETQKIIGKSIKAQNCNRLKRKNKNENYVNFHT